jgi:hypothetical protein
VFERPKATSSQGTYRLSKAHEREYATQAMCRVLGEALTHRVGVLGFKRACICMDGEELTVPPDTMADTSL